MDRCQQTQELLADYRSGVLSSRKAAWIEEHIAQCAECARELRVLDGALALVEANTPEYEPPAGLWNGVYNRITSPEPEPSSVFGDLRRWIARPVQAAGVGVAALALTISLVVITGPHNVSAPVEAASNMEYVQGHALYAGQAPLADRAAYLSVVAASSESGETRAK